mmetsp:Transcript_19318/g.40410  ORF Transcript_19318/g.40410 Transcript_19318/m.40410 type:complete len:604 (-) Transcript_19318:121-1932(-)
MMTKGWHGGRGRHCLVAVLALGSAQFVLTFVSQVKPPSTRRSQTLLAATTPDLGSTYIQPTDVEPATAWARIEEVKQRLRSYADLPKYHHRPAVENAALVWWFLRDRRLDVSEATKKLVKCLRWRQKFRVEYLGPDMFPKELRAGKGYVHQHPDIAGRPVMVAIARRHSIFDRDLLESSRMCCWMLETALKRLATLEPPSPGAAASPEGMPEQALGIFDLREFSPLQADLEVAGFLIEVLYNYYPARTGKVLLVGAPDLFKAFWDNIKPLLGRYSKLADFVTVDELRENYFKPGLEPPEFRKLARAAMPSMSTMPSMPSMMGVLTCMAFAGGSLAAWKTWKLRPLHRGRSARAASLVGVGSSQISATTVVDVPSAEVAIGELQRRIPGHLKWRGRPAAENRGLLWWFLRDRKMDVAEAASKLVKCLRWRDDFSVEKLGPELFMREMRSRKAYLHTHPDIAGRPVLVVVANRHNVLERRFKESCCMCAWYMERVMDKLKTLEPEMEPEIEQAIAIVDLNGFSPMQADLEFVCFVVDVIHNYYPRRFARVLMVDAPQMFESFWRSVCPMLHHYQDLAEFTTASEVCRRYFAPDQAPPELTRSFRR